MTISISPHEPDPRIVPRIVPLDEWNGKMRLFETTIGGRYKKMMNELLGGICVVAVLPQLARSFKDFPLWGYLILAYLPIILIIVRAFQLRKQFPTEAKRMFSSWEAKGLYVEFFLGGKHSAPRLGFNLRGQARAVAVPVAVATNLEQGQQQQYGQSQFAPQYGQQYGQQPQFAPHYVQAMPQQYGQVPLPQYAAPPQYTTQPQTMPPHSKS